jgi:NAD(P)-dependent dehydrogenase (short-subunit alcohol dehydrogenase family)
VKSLFDIDDADWLRLFDTNVLSGVRLSRHHAPRMPERGWGRVIFISNESALNIPREMIHYGMTKTAQLAVSRGLAEEMAGSAVTVNAVLQVRPAARAWRSFSGNRRSSRAKRWLRSKRSSSTPRPTSLIQRFAEPRGSGEPRRLSRLAGSLGNDGGGAPRGRRHRRLHRLMGT